MFAPIARRQARLARDRPPMRQRLIALGVLAVALAACSSNGGGHVATSSSTTSTTTTVTTATTSTTTTTTLPVAIAGTSLLRARVAALAQGSPTLPNLYPGSAAWSKMVSIAYRSFGSGPDLLLIEGQDGTLSWWDATLLSDLSGHYHVTIFDLPGTGYSGAATAPLSLAWLADITAGFVLTVGLSDPIVLGWGLGGEIALSLAERHPRLVSSLVLVDSTFGGAGAIEPAPGVAALLGSPSATPRALSALLFPGTAAGLRERVVWQSSLFVGTTDWLTARAIKAEAALQAATWKSSSLEKDLSQETIPALVVSGADDVVFPPQNANVLASEMPRVKVDILPGSGYGAITQDEPAFVAALEKFTG
jgi:pimeloyl-ACP methyl ester carboxylesterase